MRSRVLFCLLRDRPLNARALTYGALSHCVLATEIIRIQLRFLDVACRNDAIGFPANPLQHTTNPCGDDLDDYVLICTWIPPDMCCSGSLALKPAAMSRTQLLALAYSSMPAPLGVALRKAQS